MNSDRIARLQQLLEKNPDDSFSRYAIAMEYAGHDDAAAVRILEEVLQRDEGYIPAYQQLGIVYIRLHRTDDARAILHRGVSVARRQNDHHAADEMEEVLDGLAGP